jgi:streptogramin lyase
VGRDVWVIDQLERTLYRYGPGGDQVDSVALNFTPDDVAAGSDGSLWVLNNPGGTLTKIDAEGELRQPIRVPADTSDVAVGPDAVWVADHGGRTIRRIDPELGQSDEPIAMPGPVAAIGVDQDTGEVWAFLD